MTRYAVAVLGATGVAGGQALRALAQHPWFELCVVAASPARAGRRLGDVASERGGPPPAAGADLVLADAATLDAREVDVVFSMLPASVAGEVEARCAASTPVFSTARCFRTEPDTPLLLAGVNPGHAELLEVQRERRGWRGFVAPGPNCTTVGLALTLAPLAARFGLRSVSLTSLQALSGAGSRAAAVADAAAQNVLPYIEQEEEKVEAETRKILGRLTDGTVTPAAFGVSATCTRVPVADGHTLCVSVGLREAATPQEAAQVLRSCDPWAGRGLPSAPARWIDVSEAPDRPQPRLDRDAGGGFTTTVGRLRPDPVIGGLKYVAVTHNTVLGAAGGAILLAEDLADRGLLPAR